MGVLVHKNYEGGHFVHLQIFPVYNMDTNTPQDGFINIDEEQVSFRVTIGHEPHALASKFPPPTSSKTLGVNLWVDAGQEIWISTSRANKYIVNGTTSKQPTPIS